MTKDEDFLRIGIAAGAHGLKGRLKVVIITDIIERFSEGGSVYFQEGEGYRRALITHFQPQGRNSCILGLEGLTDRDQAHSLAGRDLLIPRSEAEKMKSDLGPDEYFYFDIIGCAVLIDGKKYGTVSDVYDAGANPVLLIADSNGKTHMVPFVSSMVDTERIAEKILTLHPIDGLLDF